MDRDDMVQNREIDGNKFTAVKLPPKTAWSLQLRVMKVLGPALKQVASLANEKDQSVQEESALTMFGEFMGTMDPDEVLNLLEEICSHASKDGKSIKSEGFNVSFADNHMTAIKVAVFVLQVNLGAFFDATTQSKLGQTMMSVGQNS